ncbi:MAG TPA: DUF1345 domain-containing protein [Novosphingobium sp.]|nr:DUF1345 domain-containing protein [Novosphingobium sp.]
MGTFLAPIRFLVFIATFAAVGLAARSTGISAGSADAVVVGFDAAAALFLVSLLPLFRDRGADVIRRHADANDANRVLVLLVAGTITVVVMTAIAGELPAARHGDPFAIAKLIATLLLAWLFLNMVFALHYAHDFYRRDDATGQDAGGIEFPGTKEPSYGDFAYFALTMGMTFQTSDCEITDRGMRAVAVLHSFVSYLFSIGVIAFTINALGAGG